MTAEVMEEHYRHSAGLKPTLEIAAVYDRYAELSTLDQVRALDRPRAPMALRRFAVETYVGDGRKHLTDRAANAESELVVHANGEAVPYRAVRPALRNEP